MQKYLINLLLIILAVSLIVFLADRWWQRFSRPTVLCPGCNVIIIDIDTFRADAFDCKGKPGDSGYPPNLCEFVKDAFKFENNFSQSHWTLPSAVSTHTGLYPPEHGLEKLGDELSKKFKAVMMPEIFQRNGYFTVRYIYDGGHYVSNRSNTDGGYSKLVNSEYNQIWKFPNQVWNFEASRLQAMNQPFYALFYTGALHSPYTLSADDPFLLSMKDQSSFPLTQEEINQIVQQKLIENYENIFTDEVAGIQKDDLLQFFYSIQQDEQKQKIYLKDRWEYIYYPIIFSIYQNVTDESPAAIDLLHQIYNAKVMRVDREIKSFLESLAELGLMKNSVIVFMSDHGEAFYEHGVFEHVISPASQYNEMIHVPLYVFVPGIKGKVIKSVSRNIDIFPTIFEIIGLNDTVLKTQGYGKSLERPMLGDEKLIQLFDNRYAISFTGPLVSIQDIRYKMILDLCNEERIEIYDLMKDPLEKRNIVLQSGYISRRMMKALTKEFGFNLRGSGINWREKFGQDMEGC